MPPTAATKPGSPAIGANPSATDAAEAGRRASRSILEGLIAGHRDERVRERDGLRAELGSDEARALAIAASAIDEGKVGEVARRYESANENGLFRALGTLERLQAREVLGDEPEPEETGPEGVEADPSGADEPAGKTLELGEAPVVVGPSPVPEALTKRIDASIRPSSKGEGLAHARPSSPLPNEAKDRAEARRSSVLPNEAKDSGDRGAWGGSSVLPNEAKDRAEALRSTSLPNEANGRDDRVDRAGTAALPNEANGPEWVARVVPTLASSATANPPGGGTTPPARRCVAGKAGSRRRKAEIRRQQAERRRRKVETR